MFSFAEYLDGKEIHEMERRFLINWKASRAARKKSNERMTDEHAAYVQFCKQTNWSLHAYLKVREIIKLQLKINILRIVYKTLVPVMSPKDMSRNWAFSNIKFNFGTSWCIFFLTSQSPTNMERSS